MVGMMTPTVGTGPVVGVGEGVRATGDHDGNRGDQAPEARQLRLDKVPPVGGPVDLAHSQAERVHQVDV